MGYIEEEFDKRDCTNKERTRNHGNTCRHLVTLRKYTEKVNIVTEFGTGHSTFGLLMGKPKKLTTYDINPKINIEQIQKENKNFKCIVADTSEIKIENTDLLYIDSLHTYYHLSKELELHSKNVNKYIICHDTETFGRNDQINENYDGKNKSNGKEGLMTAIEDFLLKNIEWKIIEHITYQHGLTIMERK